MDETIKMLVVREADAIKSEIARLREDSNHRHEENVERLDRIEEEVRATNGRVNLHDFDIKTLKEKVAAFKAGITTGDLSAWWVIILGVIVGTFIVLTQVLGFHRG